ncbi:golvesin C-terminal-like domain-containing protein [Streptomyces sp. MUM 178J]|uniref:golvesin C-terminal-like domain-containing protein n=1 Tax=Streptomyces sp. MUM 178J TaxID=2791991 RepID=UPI001F0448C6|nr:hypothetical protein [Streptomyces sp. MUM 178J]WRQ79534.1 hypothetical protein I3F59_009245 [Streptomyces sp. MUM 178J]
MSVPLTLPAQAQDPTTPPKSAANGPAEAKRPDKKYPSAIPSHKRKEITGAASDRALTTSGDGTGFHLLTAEGGAGYEWKTAATLSEPGFEAGTWIGNACVTGSGKRAAVAYAPRTFTNKPELMVRGAFAAVVDLESGNVKKLPFQASLAYFSPGCGAGEEVVFTQLSHDGDAEQQTRLISVDAATGRAAEPVAYPGQVTSAVPVKDGIVAAHGSRVVKAGANGKLTQVARTTSVPFQLTVDADGGITYIDRTRADSSGRKSISFARHLASGQLRERNAVPVTVASGRLTDWDLASTAEGTVFITGKAKTNGRLPKRVKNPGGIAKGARLSTRGQAAVTTAWADGKDTRIRPDEALMERTARTSLRILTTGKTVTLDALPGSKRIGGAKAEQQGRSASPALPQPASGLSAQTARTRAVAASPSDPGEGESERTCSVGRNDVRKQAFQPTPRQVEWAVDQAVVGRLDFYRSPNWKNTGTGGYTPQNLFPPILLEGDPNGTLDSEDGDNDRWHIPAQILLGVTAQESNMWQATRFAVPGVTANSLIGNYYGVDYAASGEQLDPWRINWDDADCGYGITQATDGMRLPGHGQPTLSRLKQEAIALDYTANIAAGAQILSEKWNQTRNAGMSVNDGHPKWIENWFFALWAYNSGFYPTPDSAGHWGVGFTNNPANPLWKANRTPFLENHSGGDDYSHAAHPQDWPYQEKVIGWAARPIAALFGPGDIKAGYRPAWWNTAADRTAAKPPIDLFCNESNFCDPGRIGEGDSNDPGQGACLIDGDKTNPHWLHCWWNQPVEWKSCDRGAQCGYQVHRFNTSYPEQPDANSYPPRCSTGLPANALIVDDVKAGVTPAGSDARSCGPVKSDGTFTFDFTEWQGTYPGKIDTHQIGAGYQNHFWFTHTRQPEAFPGNANRMKITGTWKLGQKITSHGGQAKVYAHIPDHGAQTKEAIYTIKHANGTATKKISQTDNETNKWVDLGAYQFNDTVPEVSLSNFNSSGNGDKDVAWDAIAFVPGDYDGLPEVRFPEADPNAPPVDFEDSQVAKEAGPTGTRISAPRGHSATPSPSAGASSGRPCQTDKGGVTVCAEYRAVADSKSEDEKAGKALAAPQRGSVAAGPVGWCKNVNGAFMYTRTEGCLRGLIVLTATRNGKPIGNATMNMVQEIDLNPKSSQFTTWTEISLVNMTGISSTTLTSFKEECWPTTGCAESVGPWTGTTTWTAGDSHVATRTNTYAWNKVTGGMGTLNLDWTTSWSTPQAVIQAVPKWSHQAFDIRCDNKVGGNTGCVFPKYTPTLTMNTAQYPAAAAYYWVLMQKLATHPGSEEHNRPLHRLADETKAKENRDKMCFKAVAEWNPHPNATGKSCDEYPFAKSRESGGMTLTSGKHCVQMYSEKQADSSWLLELDNNYPYPHWKEICGRAAVPKQQNTDAGGDLGRFTSEIRLMDNDPYFVQTGFEFCDIKKVCNIS